MVQLFNRFRKRRREPRNAFRDAERMLKWLTKEHDNNPLRFSAPDISVDEWELIVSSGICSANKINESDYYNGHNLNYVFNTIFQEMEERGWIERWSRGGIPSYIFPKAKGLDYGRLLMRPRWRKVVDAVKGDVRTVAVAIITALIITLLTNWLLRLFGWMP